MDYIELKKNFSWETEGVIYTIRNVPHEIHEEYDEPLLDISVASIVSTLGNLIVTGEIPETELNYEDFSESNMKNPQIE